MQISDLRQGVEGTIAVTYIPPLLWSISGEWVLTLVKYMLAEIPGELLSKKYGSWSLKISRKAFCSQML